MKEKPVYSTDTGRGKKEKNRKKWETFEGAAKMRLETKGRGGKSVTVIFNLPFTEAEAKRIMKDIQAVAGCGGAIKNSTIELRGDVRSKVEDYFENKNLKVVRAGG